MKKKKKTRHQTRLLIIIFILLKKSARIITNEIYEVCIRKRKIPYVNLVLYCLLTFLLHATCSLIIYVDESNKIRIVHSTSKQAMSRFFSPFLFLSLVYFFFQSENQQKDKRSVQQSLTKPKNAQHYWCIRTYIYTEKTMDERWAELCQLSALFSRFLLVLIPSISFFDVDNNNNNNNSKNWW